MRANRPFPLVLDEADQTEREIIEEMVIPDKANHTLSFRIQQRVNKSCFLYIQFRLILSGREIKLKGLLLL